jgi:pimeloyl-ACP methyl ester carboxylesterase
LSPLPSASSSPASRRPLRLQALALIAVPAIAFLLIIGPLALDHLRAASVLARFADPQATGLVAGFERRPVEEALVAIPSGAGPIRGRLYLPARPSGAGLVLVHGIHQLGIDEPRLVRFSRALAASGITVLTPELAALADYHVDQHSTADIGSAAHALRERLSSHAPVGVVGLSFAGGLSLLAAADPRFAPDIAFVVAIGAHDDLERVSRFLVTGQIARVDGSTLTLKPHEYGLLVLVYARIELFFSPADVPLARQALKAWLGEDPKASSMLASLSPEGRTRLQALFDHHDEAVAPLLLAQVDRERAELDRASPHGHLADLHVPVFLLHGAGDSVIPPSETEWLSRDVPEGLVRAALISPAIVHVETQGKPSLRERLALVHFLALVLEQADLSARFGQR